MIPDECCPPVYRGVLVQAVSSDAVSSISKIAFRRRQGLLSASASTWQAWAAEGAPSTVGPRKTTSLNASGATAQYKPVRRGAVPECDTVNEVPRSWASIPLQLLLIAHGISRTVACFARASSPRHQYLVIPLHLASRCSGICIIQISPLPLGESEVPDWDTAQSSSRPVLIVAAARPCRSSTSMISSLSHLPSLQAAHVLLCRSDSRWTSGLAS